VPWVRTLRDIYEKHEGGTPQYRLGLWKGALNSTYFSEKFEPWKIAKFQHTVLCTREMIWERVLSKSYVSILDCDQQERLRSEVMKVLLGNDIRSHVRRVSTLGQEAIEMIEFPYTVDIITFPTERDLRGCMAVASAWWITVNI
jgi:hypothetical protein